jgi:BCD family chlorophyll transporter-like MFS transporter
VAVTTGVALISVAVTMAAVWKIEDPRPDDPPSAAASPPSFWAALAEVWAEPQARRFTTFVFLSMLAYSAEELILDPFSGAVFGYTPGESTKLSGVLHGGVLAGMILVALAASSFGGKRMGSLRAWAAGGCFASALMLASLTLAGFNGPGWPLIPTVFILGLANGAFSIAAISLMMSFAGRGGKRREGVRIGLWGAAQGVAFGFGGLAGAAASDAARHLFASQGEAYAAVFFGEALVFIVAAFVALRLTETSRQLAERQTEVSGQIIPTPAQGALSAANGVMR